MEFNNMGGGGRDIGISGPYPGPTPLYGYMIPPPRMLTISHITLRNLSFVPPLRDLFQGGTPLIFIQIFTHRAFGTDPPSWDPRWDPLCRPIYNV